jgi:vancomycin permeability regulator SanA
MAIVGAQLRWWQLSGAVVLAFAALAGPNAWVARAARNYAYESVSSVPPRSVAIVPGASTFRGAPLPRLKDRLQAALTLFHEGRVKAIFVSGSNGAADPEVAVMRTWLEARGVAPGDIWSDEAGSRTRETMLNAAALFNITDAVICTQALFLPRALFLAQHAGINAVGVSLRTPHSGSARFVGTEALKTALAFWESYLRAGPATEETVSAPTAVAVR